MREPWEWGAQCGRPQRAGRGWGVLLGKGGGFWRWGGNGKDPRVVVEPMGETTRECGRQWEKAWGLRGGWERPPTMGGGGGGGGGGARGGGGGSTERWEGNGRDPGGR